MAAAARQGSARQGEGSAKIEAMGFEDAMTRLEALVQRMEEGELGLDEMVNAYEEGQRLVKHCGGKLNEVERRIELLTKGENGVITSEPFRLSDGSDDKLL